MSFSTGFKKLDEFVAFPEYLDLTPFLAPKREDFGLVGKKGHKGKKGKKDKEKDDGPAYWPLIRQVRVRCNARALSTGAILVDLPGVADANAARNNIAKDYMKKCDCVWILAPITRAVDDKTARGEPLSPAGA